MFEHPGELAFYLILVAVKFAGYFFLMLLVQSWYRCLRDVLHALGATLAATGVDEAILLFLVTLWPILAKDNPDFAWYSAQSLLSVFLLLACFRFLIWLCVLWMFFRTEFRSHPSKGYALAATCVSFGLDLAGLVIGMATPAGRHVFFF